MWLYKGKFYEEIHDDTLYGFIYVILHKPTGKKYVGRKNFFSKRTVKKGKKELASMKDKRGSKKKKVVKESDWKTYQSSNEFLKKESSENLIREIVLFCKTEKQMNYYETKLLFQLEVLESNNWLNDNISGKFFRKDLN